MRRNWELLRKILEDAEGERLGDELIALRAKKKRSAADDRLAGHIRLAIDAGWLMGVDFSANVCDPWLTMSGHDMLALMRSTRWTEITGAALDGGIPVTVDYIRSFKAGE